MRLEIISIYKFEELPKEMREKLIEKHQNINVEGVNWYQYTTEDWKKKLEEKGFTDEEIYFSGFWSQGDGACFDAQVDVSRLAVAVYARDDESYYREVLQFFADNGPRVLAYVKTNDSHYSHANTRYISVDKDLSDIENRVENIMNADLALVPPMISEYEGVDSTLSGLVSIRLKYQARAMGLDELLNKFEKDADELRKNLSNEIYRDLEKEYEGLTSDESVAEALDNYEFDEDGGMI